MASGVPHLPAAFKGGFPTTRWTLIRKAKGDPETRRRALEDLLSIYWQPLYHYARRKGLDRDAAQDAVQGLCLRLLEGDAVARLDPDKGRLRGYLKRALDHHLINVHAHGGAVKRGGDTVTLPLDADMAERLLTGAPQDPGRAYDRQWARALVDRALERLRQDFESGDRRGPFAAVMPFFGADEAPPYEVVARTHGLTVPQLKSMLHRARARFRHHVGELVADTVTEAGEVEAETRTLFEALAG